MSLTLYSAQLMKSFLILFLALGLVTPTSAQKRRVRAAQRDVRVSRTQPTVFISFVRMGEIEPAETGVSNKYVWLRLRNNTRWTINLQASGVSTKEYGDTRLYYGVETEPVDIQLIHVPALPPLMPPLLEAQQPKAPIPEKPSVEEEKCQVSIPAGCHVCSVIQLRSGESLIFSVPRDYLCKNLKIYVPFNYEWEEDNFDFYGNTEPQHRVYFFGSSLTGKG